MARKVQKVKKIYFDFSAEAVDDPIMKVVADAISSAGAVAGQIAIKVGDDTRYLVYYQHGS